MTARALRVAGEVGEPHASLLRLLVDCYAEDHGRGWYAQQRGASYKALALAAHKAGLTKEQRVAWYGVAESIPLSQRHAGHIIARMGG